MATKALNQLIWDAHWGDLDYLVDLPPGTGDIHLSLVQSTRYSERYFHLSLFQLQTQEKA